MYILNLDHIQSVLHARLNILSGDIGVVVSDHSFERNSLADQLTHFRHRYPRASDTRFSKMDAWVDSDSLPRQRGSPLAKKILAHARLVRNPRFRQASGNAAEQLPPLHENPLSLDATEHCVKLYYRDQSDRWDQKNIVEEFRLVNDKSLPFLFGSAWVARNCEIITSGSGITPRPAKGICGCSASAPFDLTTCWQESSAKAPNAAEPQPKKMRLRRA